MIDSRRSTGKCVTPGCKNDPMPEFRNCQSHRERRNGYVKRYYIQRKSEREASACKQIVDGKSTPEETVEKHDSEEEQPSGSFAKDKQVAAGKQPVGDQSGTMNKQETLEPAAGTPTNAEKEKLQDTLLSSAKRTKLLSSHPHGLGLRLVDEKFSAEGPDV